MGRTDNLAEVIDNGQDRYDEYVDLLMKRDQLLKEADSYMDICTKEFGDLITANYEMKVECIKKKKAVSYCRRRMNRGLAIDFSHMHDEIDHEMTRYYEKLKEMRRDAERAKSSESIGEFRFTRAKKMYRRLSEKLHPDINMKTRENGTLKELWERIAEAYRRSDVELLDSMEAEAGRVMGSLGNEGFEPDCSDIENRIDRVERQIHEIMTTEPYVFGEIFKNEGKKEAYRERLRAEHDDFENYLDILKKTLGDMIHGGGVQLVKVINWGN